MKIAALILLGIMMTIGAYAILQATAKEQAAQAEQVSHESHCQLINQQIIKEFDEVIAKGKFPTDLQQDYWRQISAGCQD